MDRTKPVEHLPKISRATVDILSWIVPIGYAEFSCGCRHELRKSGCTSRTDRHRIEPGFLPDQCLKQARRQSIPYFSLPDEGFVERLFVTSMGWG